jgi:hydrogenase maturation protease
MNAVRAETVLVLGLGNTLLGDDGVGVHVARRLGSDAAMPPWVRVVDGGTMGFRLTSVLGDGGDVLMIDAADFAAAPGSLRLMGAAALAEHVAGGKRTSAHEAGLADLLGLMRLEGWLPRHLAVLAIQPLVVDWGEALSEEVANAVGPACEMAKATIAAWRGA